MFKRNSQGRFDFRETAGRCAMGDVEAMFQMSKWFRSQLDREFLGLEQEMERYPCRKDLTAEMRKLREAARQKMSAYVSRHDKALFAWRASNFWMNRAALYGHTAAKQLAQEHPVRCLNAYLSPYDMLPIDQGRSSHRGEELNRLGLLQFHGSEEYDLHGMSKNGTFHAQIYRGYDGPDETGFGMEEEWDDYYYDEFFNLLKKDRRASLKEQEESRRQYWSKPWNRKEGTPYHSGILTMELQIVKEGILILCMGSRQVTVPEGITAIGDHAFYHNTAVESITLPASVETVGRYAFSGCDSLRQVTFSVGLKRLGDRAFFHSHALETLELPDGLEEIGEGAFLGCHALQEIHVPQSVTQIGKSAFMYCEALEQAALPSGLRRIEAETFFLCNKLSRIELPKNLEHIGDKAFYRCPCEHTVAKKYPHLYQPEEKQKKFLGLF